MFHSFSELLKTKDEQKFINARAALEAAGIKYRVFSSSVEGAGMVTMAAGHALGRPRNPGTNVRPMVEDGAHNMVYILEVRKKSLGKAKILIG